MADELHNVMMELGTAVVFGRPLEMPITELVRRKNACLALEAPASSRGYRLLDSLSLRRRLRGLDAYERLLSLMTQEIAERRRVGLDGDDLLTQLLHVSEREDIPIEQVAGEAVGWLLAMNYMGVGAVSFALYYLTQREPLRDHIRREGDLLLDNEDPPLPESLSYTKAVVNESLRLHPTFAFVTREARREAQFGERHFRPGDVVVVCPFLVHRDERWWQDPDVFQPERWLADRDPTFFSFLPFGAGPHRCIGSLVASRVMTATVAIAIALWNMRSLTQPRDLTAGRPADLRLRLDRRRV